MVPLTIEGFTGTRGCLAVRIGYSQRQVTSISVKSRLAGRQPLLGDGVPREQTGRMATMPPASVQHEEVFLHMTGWQATVLHSVRRRCVDLCNTCAALCR